MCLSVCCNLSKPSKASKKTERKCEHLFARRVNQREENDKRTKVVEEEEEEGEEEEEEGEEEEEETPGFAVCACSKVETFCGG